MNITMGAATLCGPKPIAEQRDKATFSRVVQILAFVLAFLQTCPLAAMQNASTTSSSSVAQRIKNDVSQIPIDGKLTVKKLDGTEYHGKLQSIETDEFSIREVDLKKTIIIRYDQVDQVRKNYGHKGASGGRVGTRKNWIVAGVTIGVIFTILIVALAKDKS